MMNDERWMMKTRKPGAMRGKIHMAADFDANDEFIEKLFLGR